MIHWYERKDFFSKVKNAYFQRFNIHKFWRDLKINKIDNELKTLVDLYLSSDSRKFTSKYWDKININNLDQINQLGVEKFHTSVSNFYFTWKSINDENIKELFGFFGVNKFGPVESNMLLKKHNGLTITQSINYNLLTLLLYQFLVKDNNLPKLEILEKNDYLIDNCPVLNINSLRINQDKLNSLIEYNQIQKIINLDKLKLNYLEIGAGSGRTTETFLRLDKKVNKYVIADIPPALYINYNRIKHSFKDLKVELGVNIKSNQDLMKSLNKNDVLFIFPHHLEYFDDSFFDISVAINCLHEMKKRVVKKYMEIFNKKSKYLYFKVYEQIYLPYAFNNYFNANNKKTYFINQSWKELYKNKCVFPANFMELVYKIKD